jgi:hypothetical protein
MRALAEFMMRGRLQAGTIAILGYIIPLLAPAAVALTTLRKGATEGVIILLVGAVPALLSLWFGEGNALITWMALLSLLVVYVPALILRTTISLSSMMLSAIAAATLIALTTLWVAPDVVETMSGNVIEQMEVLEQQAEESQSDKQVQAMVPLLTLATTVGMSGLLAYILTVNGLIGVLFGRWLQSLAYNPDGFGEEFRGLRLGLGFSVVCFLGNVLLSYQGDQYWWWSNILALPLLLVAAAVAHEIVRQRALGAQWLILFYILTLVLMPVVMSIGFLDAWLNFRDRLQKQ